MLQLIRLAYLFAALLTQGRPAKQHATTIAVVLYAYWFAMTIMPISGSGAMRQLVLSDAPRTMSAWWNRFLPDWSRFGLSNHTWVNSETGDPEGLFTTMPSICTAILGNLAGQRLGNKLSLEQQPPMYCSPSARSA